MYVGDVGTGFSQAQRAELLAELAPLERPSHPFAQTPPREDIRRARWLEPRLVGEVVYRQLTRRAGRLRHTSWRGLRPDRSADEVLVPGARPDNPAETPAGTSEPPSAVPGQRITVQVNDKRLTLSNLDKVLYPAVGFTKGEVINYYAQTADVLLPHLRDRPVTFVRWPDGVDQHAFFENNVAPGAPPWLRTVRLASAGSRGSGEIIEYPLLDDLPALVWAANVAALELHVPQWTTTTDGQRQPPDRLVFDLDPGPGAPIVDCCRVAERLYEVLLADGLTPFAKTSGSKGMQLYCALDPGPADAPSAYAKRLAQQLARETPHAVTAVMAKTQRAGRVFIDWSQNHPAKTTIAPYSLRGRDHPTVSTPISWDEVRDCRHVNHLTFTAEDVLARVTKIGHLLTDLANTGSAIPAP